jgi:hypothetical protein
MRFIFTMACSVALLPGTVCASAQNAPAQASSAAKATGSSKAGGPAKQVAKSDLPQKPVALLPDSFAGWIAAETPKAVTDPARIDPANVAALKEYDFANGMMATYKRSGETLTVHALRFSDASGAYGAYSFYRQNGWPKEDIGSGATSDHNRVLFWKGNTLVDATFSQIGPLSGSELRELAAGLPAPEGTKALAPPILNNLPKDSLDPQTTHYALGPAAYAGSGGVLPADLVGFDRGAEAVTATYSLRSGPAALTIIDYPTPQLAMAQEAKIRAFIHSGNPAAGNSAAASPAAGNGTSPTSAASVPVQGAWPKPLADSDQASLEVRRSGPLVALVSGDAIPEESHKLLATVHYEMDLTTIPQPSDSEVAKTGRLLMGIATLVIIGCSAAVLLGLFLGGGRALLRRMRGKPVSSVYEAEFLHLDLREEWVETAPGVDSPHTKG